MALRHAAVPQELESTGVSQRVYRVGSLPPAAEPTPPSYSGDQLEHDVHVHIARALRHSRDQIKVNRQSGAGDRGIDVLIEATVPFSLFGLEFTPRNSRLRVAVQCKYTTERYASIEKTAHSAAQARRENIDYFILVTNKAVTPKTHYILCADLFEYGIDFHLVEGWRLAELLFDTNPSPPSAEESGFRCEYQYERSLTDGAPSVDLFYVVHNHLARDAGYELALDSDHDWALDGAGAQGALGPFGSRSGRLLVRQRGLGGLDDLVLHCTVDQTTAEIVLAGDRVRFDFVPRFFGQRHRRLLSQIVALIDDPSTGTVILLRGAAGCGKSRIMDEIYRRRGENDFQIYVIKIDETTTKEGLSATIARLRGVEPSSLAHQLVELSRDRLQTLLVLDDLHNARREILQDLSSLVGGPEPLPPGICVILSGRDDYTFENPLYISFLEAVRYARERRHPGVHEFEVLPFSDGDAHAFIRATVRDLPEAAEDAVFRIGQNVPFNLIHAFEHILERRFAYIVNANTIAISNVSVFLARETLPEGMLDLLERRFQVLRTDRQGERIAGMLIAASYLGISFSTAVVAAEFGDTADEERVVERLVSRKFLTRGSDGTLAFSHENIRLYLRQLLAKPDVKSEAANRLLRWHAFSPLLDDLKRGEVYQWAGNDAAALRLFDPIRAQIRLIQNISANQVDFGYFEYLTAVFEAALQGRVPVVELRTILLTRVFMAIHNYSPQRGVMECDAVLQAGQRVPFADDERRGFERTVRQLKAHALINTGRLLPAYAIMKELETDLEFGTDAGRFSDLATAFDLNNRLHDIYVKWNHLRVAANYVERATAVAMQMESVSRNGLLALQNEAEARLHMQQNPQMTYRKMRKTIAHSRQHAPFRNNLHNELTLLVSEAYVHRNDQCELQRLVPRVEQLLLNATRYGCTGSIPRSYLILSTLALVAETDSTVNVGSALRLAENGINSSLRLGYQTYLWLLYNVRAICALRLGATANDTLRFFNTAVDCLTNQDLLFLGNLDLCYPNVLVLSNYCRFLLPMRHENAVYRFLRTVRAYDQTWFTDQAALKRMILHLRKTGALLGNWSRKSGGPLQDKTGYWLPLH
jgi:hypothetical protein